MNFKMEKESSAWVIMTLLLPQNHVYLQEKDILLAEFAILGYNLLGCKKRQIEGCRVFLVFINIQYLIKPIITLMQFTLNQNTTQGNKQSVPYVDLQCKHDKLTTNSTYKQIAEIYCQDNSIIVEPLNIRTQGTISM